MYNFTPTPNNFSPGISPIAGGQPTPINNGQDALLGMLQQLVQHRLGVSSLGTNRYKVAPGQALDGYTDATGMFHPGSPGM